MPLSFAYDFARKGYSVDILFLDMALLALTQEGLKSLTVEGRHANKKPWLRQQLEAADAPPDVYEFLKIIKQSGQVRLKGCRDSAQILNVKSEELIPESEGLIDSTTFIENAIKEGVHCMYF